MIEEIKSFLVLIIVISATCVMFSMLCMMRNRDMDKEESKFFPQFFLVYVLDDSRLKLRGKKYKKMLSYSFIIFFVASIANIILGFLDALL